jgi:hypothetical protein
VGCLLELASVVADQRAAWELEVALMEVVLMEVVLMEVVLMEMVLLDVVTEPVQQEVWEEDQWSCLEEAIAVAMVRAQSWRTGGTVVLCLEVVPALVPEKARFSKQTRDVALDQGHQIRGVASEDQKHPAEA